MRPGPVMFRAVVFALALAAGALGCSGKPCSAVCGGVCTDTKKDADNCGACGVRCGEQFCSNGTCVAACPAGRTACHGGCVDLSSDAESCGRCGNDCNGGTCSGGTCVCPPGAWVCDNRCVDLRSDPENCGACGAACAPGTRCQGGSCS